MRRLLLASCVDDIERVLTYVGVDVETEVVLVGYECRGGRYRVVDIKLNDVARSIAELISLTRGFDRVRVVLHGRDSVSYTALILGYMTLSSIGGIVGIELDPLTVVFRGRVVEHNIRPRLCVRDARDLGIVRAIDGECLDSYRVSSRSGIPVSTVRRRLNSLSRYGLTYSYREGKRNIYCLTDLGKMLSI